MRFVPLVCIVSVCLMIICGKEQAERKRPCRLPTGAFWVGGVDGGCWMTYSEKSHPAYFFGVYFENGKLMDEGEYILHGPTRLDTSTLSAFDGQRILLKDGSYLERKPDTSSGLGHFLDSFSNVIDSLWPECSNGRKYSEFEWHVPDSEKTPASLRQRFGIADTHFADTIWHPCTTYAWNCGNRFIGFSFKNDGSFLASCFGTILQNRRYAVDGFGMSLKGD